METRIENTIPLIYHCRFDEAENIFDSIIIEYPSEPEGYFFSAMVTYWKILMDRENTQFDEKYFSQIEKTIEVCDKKLDSNENDVNAMFYKGGALGYRGRLEVHRKSWLSAILDGKKGLSLMMEAYERDKKNTDTFLGIGLYQYYAEAIPEEFPIVKPLMWFLPSGDKEKGIEFLTRASKEGRFTNIEATYFLLQIRFRFENDYEKALPLAEELHNGFLENPLFKRIYEKCIETLHLKK
ncbi:MAG: hypothetical protein KGZ58_14080 [Ignavibacteriales bacterium]|nr:hypothetical protein [Ignavibacteriales bacterium]